MENQKKRQEAGRKPQQTTTNMWKTMGTYRKPSETCGKPLGNHRKPSETRPETIGNPYEGTDSPFEQLQKVNAKERG